MTKEFYNAFKIFKMYISKYSEVLSSVEIVFIITALLMILLIYLKSYRVIIIETVWVYSSLIPAIMIVFLNHTSKIFLTAVYFGLQTLFLFLYMKNMKKNYLKLLASSSTPLSKINNIENNDYGKEKSLEYVSLFILPFITVNSSVNPFAIVLILLIVVLIIKRFELFYLNLPILLFFKIQVITTNKRVKMIVLTKRNFKFQLNQEYDIRSFSRNLKLYIYLGE